MNENNELLEYMYQDAEMSTYTLTELLEELKGRDNKIVKDIEKILKEYEGYLKDFQKQLKKEDIGCKPKGMLSKMMAKMGIKKEVIHDNSDGSIADMLIKGISMGSLDMEKKITQYKESVNKKTLDLAKDFLKFQEDTIEELKSYL